ncbi:hypothetical protein GUJ93_ZPchr0013g35560 [Zizania palustris]|uniref:J domain-containing protein n=1 Tax=Zizania palustris TaxID=103762 RepID=A0A8J5X5N3_ZIZPA|nr:hypothetical protein GUJ93_ZPchr0013g35560 [Zizania palustris]
MASQEDDRAGSGGGGRKEQERRPSKAWGILLFGLIAATTSTFAVAQIRRSANWFYSQQHLGRMQATTLVVEVSARMLGKDIINVCSRNMRMNKRELLRATPYTDAEVKNAFRTKAMEVHPDQNQDNREAAEEKFKEVVKSYEAIKLERKDDAS